jgi:HSP20 family protein
MATKALSGIVRTPSLMQDLFRPWNEFFETPAFFGKMLTTPAVNVKEEPGQYMLSIAVPGFKKEDFKIGVDANMITVSSEKEEMMNEVEEQFTRREYNFTSFSRTFSIPDDVMQDAIDATYSDGILMLKLPRRQDQSPGTAKKNIAVK